MTVGDPLSLSLELDWTVDCRDKEHLSLLLLLLLLLSPNCPTYNENNQNKSHQIPLTSS